MQLEPIQETQESDNTAPQLVIWGTNVSVQQCKIKFKQFILRYIDPTVEEDELTDGMNVNEPLYLQKLEEVIILFYIFAIYLNMYNYISILII